MNAILQIPLATVLLLGCVASQTLAQSEAPAVAAEATIAGHSDSTFRVQPPLWGVRWYLPENRSDTRIAPFDLSAAGASTWLMSSHPPILAPGFSNRFKYDTTWNNPAHRCYEINKPITEGYNFLFNLIPFQRYTEGAIR